jgi:hypothetical protein
LNSGVITCTDAALSADAPGLKDASTIEKVDLVAVRDPESSPFALALLVGRRISWFSSLVHEGKATTIR